MALILDTGVLLAGIDRDDRHHAASRALIETTDEQLVVPSPVLPEIDYWIHQRLTPAVRLQLLSEISAGTIRIENLAPSDYIRVRDICARYADADVGFVDASVLAVVERLGEPKLATLDRRHFGLLRPNHVDALRLLPD